MARNFLLMSLLFLLLFGCGCEKAYYGTMEKLGVHKRDILVDRVEDARDAQEDTKEQFASALEKFKAVTGFEGGALEEKYEELKGEFERSEDEAENVSERIDSVADVADDLFAEWEDELEDYSNDEMRSISKRRLRETRSRYADMMRVMGRAESRIGPVLSAFRDQVLFLKHNLNARAIASLQGEFENVEADIASLIEEMETSIAEANEFIENMKSS